MGRRKQLKFIKERVSVTFQELVIPEILSRNILVTELQLL